MDEIRKIPPVTRYMLAATGAVTLPCLLAITSPYRFALFWPLVTRKFHIHRIFTSFFYGGGVSNFSLTFSSSIETVTILSSTTSAGVRRTTPGRFSSWVQ